jgi:Uma2 family endonuclease
VTNPDRIPLPATLPDLYRFKCKAELIADRIVCYPLLSWAQSHTKLAIMCSLDDYSRNHPGTEAFGGNLIYAVPRMSNGRQSFCPDASFHAGPFPENRMKWIEAAPTFAVEIRVLEDQDHDADPERAAKRADYFFAGTLVVWDVDPVAETITRYTASDPLTPTVFRRGDVADAEPAVPGWRLPVDDVFG